MMKIERIKIHIDKFSIRENRNKLKAFVRKYYAIIKAEAERRFDKFMALVERKLKAPVRERNRFILLSLSLILFADYVMICFHTDRWIFDIFPSIPSLEDNREVKIFFPSSGGNIATENRRIPDLEGKERVASILLDEVRQGSRHENTRIMVPVNMIVKKIWIREIVPGEETCVIDIEPVVIKGNVPVVPGSEKLFREALQKTISHNIPSIKEVVLLEKGISRPTLWEVN